MNIFIEIVSGPEKGRSLQLSDNQVLRVGRGQKVDVALALDQSISSLHCSLECDGQTCRIRDLNSRNGTFVNGHRITEAMLKTGDEIRVGYTTLIVSIQSPAIQTSVPPPFDVTSKTAKPSRVTRSPRRFYVELYEEHLEEASFLCAQRLTLFDDPEITWVAIGEWEERLEAHIDALVIGEDLALEVSEKQAAEGDFGMLFAVASVFCRQRRFDLLKKVLEPLGSEDLEKLQAVADALKYECPPEWESEIAHVLPVTDPRLIFILATLYGCRRKKFGEGLVADIATLPPAVVQKLAWAKGRRDDKQGKSQLQDWLKHEDESVRSATAVALLRLGEQKLVQEATLQNGISAAPWSIRAIAATPKELTLLLAQVGRNKPETDSLIALGIMGEITAVPILLSYLADEAMAPAAALGLNLITGAELYEKVFIPEVMDEDELFDEEKEQVKKGQPVLRPDGKPYGENVVRLSQKPEEWKTWWMANQNRFSRGLRYRSGVPVTPAVLVDNLAFPKTPRKIRQLAYEELVIRYGADIPFETDMPVRQQQEAIAKWKGWVAANEARFKPGKWYLGEQLIAP
ncbi:MAG TPA: FHA domain-containing protein [Nitrospira sp.]|nr:FHA domain-containing protein [Nitrospira sp.]